MRRLGWLFVVVAVAAAGAAVWRAAPRPAASGPDPSVATLPAPLPVPEFELLASNGRAARLSDWRGSVMLVLFGYTSCPDVCPLTLAQLAALHERLGTPEQLQVLMITVDPERDTPARLAAYLEPFHPSFIGLTASPATIHRALTAFHALAQRADPLVLHTDAVALVNAGGRVEALYGQSAVAAGGRFDEATLVELERAVRRALRRADARSRAAGWRIMGAD